MGNWYMGPLGDLRVLPVPEPDLGIQQVRYGGTHQGLSGARTQDTTGRKTEYNFNFNYLEPDEFFWLDAMNSGHVRGPFRLLDPLKNNRLSNFSTTLSRSVGHSSILTYDRSWPTQVPIPGRSAVFTGWSGSSYIISFDPKTATAVLPAEQVTASLYARSPASHTATLSLQMLDINSGIIDTQTASATLGSSWNRFSMTRTAPAGCVAVSFRLILGSANTPVFIAAPQVEAGSTATAWGTGGGAPVVLIDSFTSTSPRFPLSNAELTLTEA